MPEMRLPAVSTQRAMSGRPPALGGAAAALRSFKAAVRSYAPVELRRNRVLYAGWPLIILGTLPFAAAIAYGMEIPVRQAMAGALTAWAVAGLPLTAVLFGAVAGAGLRGPAEDAEGPLPVSPRQRAFGALASGAAAFASNAVLIALLAGLISGEVSAVVASLASLGNWGAAGVYVFGSFLVGAGSAGWLLTTSFTAAYAARHAVLGAVAALLGGSLLLLPLGAGAALHINHGPHLAGPFLIAALAASAASAAAALLALGWSAPLAARSARVSLPGMALMCLLPLSGSLGSWAALWNSARAVRTHASAVPSSFDAKDTGPAARERRRAGMSTGMAGRLVLEGAGGKVVLLPGSEPSIAELVRGEYDRFDRVMEAFRDRDGRIWAEVASARQDGQTTVMTVWTGLGDGPLTRYMTLPPQMRLSIHDGRAVVDPSPYSYAPEDFVRLDPAKPPVLKRQ